MREFEAPAVIVTVVAETEHFAEIAVAGRADEASIETKLRGAVVKVAPIENVQVVPADIAQDPAYCPVAD